MTVSIDSLMVSTGASLCRMFRVNKLGGPVDGDEEEAEWEEHGQRGSG